MDSTQRFSNRAEAYAKYRPAYPVAVVHYLQEQYELTPDKTIADIGAGTGLSTSLFLHMGYEVFAIEPNKPMLEKAGEVLGEFPGYHPVLGTAEATSLPNESVDVIIAGQAFHWFDLKKAKTEFKRILRANGLVVLFWNERRVVSAFEKAYEELIQTYAIPELKADRKNTDINVITAFFAPSLVEVKTFPNEQVLDFNGLKGRTLSTSFMPMPTDAVFDKMIADLKKVFDQYKENDKITLSYDTRIYSGIFR